MKQLTLLVRAYGTYRKALLAAFQKEISSLTLELHIRINRITTNERGHIKINITGEDEEFVSNVIAKEFGLIPTFEELVSKTTKLGYLIDVGKVGYGLYVDIGIKNSRYIDPLIPLHRLRKQTLMQNQSIKSISKALIFVEHLPIEIEITYIDQKNQEIEAQLAMSTLTRINQWIQDDHERLLIFGVPRKLLRNTLAKLNHLQDIYEFETLGKFEHALRCKRSTHASGILAAIGPKLRGVPMHLVIPHEMEEKRDAKT
ncbi:MAG: DUF2110 family protein [Candidatus Thorarchaeota archaeon]